MLGLKKVIWISALVGWLIPTLAFPAGEIKGVVLEQNSKAPLMGTNVIIVGTQLNAAAGATAALSFRGFQPAFMCWRRR